MQQQVKHPASDGPRIPASPRSIQKGSSLGELLGRDAVDCLAHNVSLVQAGFDRASFQGAALKGLSRLAILQRGQHLARVLREHLPERYRLVCAAQCGQSPRRHRQGSAEPGLRDLRTLAGRGVERQEMADSPCAPTSGKTGRQGSIALARAGEMRRRMPKSWFFPSAPSPLLARCDRGLESSSPRQSRPVSPPPVKLCWISPTIWVS